MAEYEYLLEMRGISKSFPGVQALSEVDVKVRPGTVLALIGENGAGKSTLMKCLFGIYKHEAGKIILEGKEVCFDKPVDAINAGISMIHQELSPLRERSVAQNIFTGREPYAFGFIVDNKKIIDETQKLFDKLNIDIDPKQKMGNLTIAKMQLVEIAKAVSYHSKIVVMDEPTSSLTVAETSKLFEIINQLRSEGIGIIYITHKMDEVFEIADEVTVLRDGKFIKTLKSADTSKDELVQLMVGREMVQMFPKNYYPIGDVVLRVEDLACEGVFSGVSFEIHKGEIFGFAGLVGAGRTEVAETIFGIRKKAAGRIFVNGKEVQNATPMDAIRNGIGMITEDRRNTGVIPQSSVQFNISIANFIRYVNKFGLLNLKRMHSDAKEYSQKLRVKTPSLETKMESLSGGNQQKAIVARWLLTNSDILIIDEPTRGIDVGAKAEIHALISQLAGEGKAILMISSEMPEILSVCDRILVMYEGQMRGIVDRCEASQECIMQYSAGLNKMEVNGNVQ